MTDNVVTDNVLIGDSIFPKKSFNQKRWHDSCEWALCKVSKSFWHFSWMKAKLVILCGQIRRKVFLCDQIRRKVYESENDPSAHLSSKKIFQFSYIFRTEWI